MILTKKEVEFRIATFEQWLADNPMTHYMYRSIFKECQAYEVAKLQMTYRGVQELDVKINTSFYSQLNRI